MAYAWRPAPGALELRYLASRPDVKDFIVWRCAPSGKVPSVAGISPLLGWYEREISDLFGVEFVGHPEPHRLVLHQGARPIAPPMSSGYPADVEMPFESIESRVPELANPDVQRLPFGPVRADVVELAEMIFFYVGEHILHFHPQLFFKHRGMEKRFEGRSPAQGAILAERVSGVGSVAHALAFCQAVEQAARCAVPARALMLRSLLAELERLYNHLHYFGHLCGTTTLKVGEAQGKLLEERAKQINGRLIGQPIPQGIVDAGRASTRSEPGAVAQRGPRKLARGRRDLPGHAREHQQPSRPPDDHRRAQPPGRAGSRRNGSDRARLGRSSAIFAATTPTPHIAICP